MLTPEIDFCGSRNSPMQQTEEETKASDMYFIQFHRNAPRPFNVHIKVRASTKPGETTQCLHRNALQSMKRSLTN